ncbi:MAG: GtrA family protein [Bifidobacteriaceae bacterium]|nr:GtrA family protein [Bifidobacteriaceae bacterium]
MGFNQRLEDWAAKRGGRLSKLVAWAYEAAKFGAVGAVAYLVDNGTYLLLTKGPGQLMEPWAVRASIIASVLATGVSYLGNRYWTFSRKRASMPAKEAVGFFAANGVGILITGGCLYFSHWVLGIHGALADTIARNIGIVLGTIFRYVAYKFWVFRGQPADARPADGQPAHGQPADHQPADGQPAERQPTGEP